MLPSVEFLRFSGLFLRIVSSSRGTLLRLSDRWVSFNRSFPNASDHQVERIKNSTNGSQEDTKFEKSRMLVEP